jgi:glycosyltransferase involved in cell wall biosynthesis
MLKNLLSKLRQIEKEVYESADIVTFPSIAAKDLFLEETRITDQKKAHVVYNGIDLEQIKNISKQSKYLSNKSENNIYLLNIADHISVKNIDKVLKLVSVLKNRTNKTITLFNAGTGPLTKYYINICKELNIAQNVKFLGRIENNILISIMKNCDYFISLSERVIFDVSILEALACEIIVVANNDGGNREIIKSGVNGYLVNSDEIEDIAEIIIENDKNPLQINTSDLLNFSLNSMMNGYSSLYSI